MINFSGISNKSLLGRFLRFTLRLLPKNMVVPIIQGPLKGKKWIVGAGVHGYWLGSYEYEKQLLFTRLISNYVSRKGKAVVYDIGANVGFYTLLASILVGSEGKVIAFEPLPRNIYYLKKHIELNMCKNVLILEVAVADKNGLAYFDDSRDPSMGCISNRGNLQVKTVSLDELVNTAQIPPPDFIKIDVEGAELLVLNGARRVLIEYSPVIFLSTHGKDIHLACINLLKTLGYKFKSIEKGKTYEEANEILAFKEENKE